jgi:hypothetical protein
MGGEQAASVLATVRRDGIEAKGGSWSAEEEAAFKQPMLDQFAHQSHPYFASARLWDDGVIDPADTRRVLALGLSARAQRADPRARSSACSACKARHDRRVHLHHPRARTAAGPGGTFPGAKVEPHAVAWEEQGFVPREVLRRMGQAGLFGLMYEGRYGGGDADALTNLVFAEALSQSTFAGFIITVLVHTDMASPHLHHAGNEAQKEAYLSK